MDQAHSVKLKTIAEQLHFQIVRESADYEHIEISNVNLNRPGLLLAGYCDYFDDDRIQLIGLIETAYLQQFTPEERLARFENLMAKKIPALIICHDVETMPECLEMAEKYDITLFKTNTDTSELMANLIGFLREQLAPRITRHGVLVEIYGEGVLLLGESGVGKSEAAIELVKRGHRLIADDAVEIKRIDSRTLQGTAPELIRYYIELRGIGVIDLRRIFGSGAVKLHETIDLVINIESWQEGMTYDRLGANEQYTNILGVDVPFLTIPIKPGRNLAVILEVAAMNNRQKKMGYNSAKEFTDRINHHFEQQMAGGMID